MIKHSGVSTIMKVYKCSQTKSDSPHRKGEKMSFPCGLISVHNRLGVGRLADHYHHLRGTSTTTSSRRSCNSGMLHYLLDPVNAEILGSITHNPVVFSALDV